MDTEGDRYLRLERSHFRQHLDALLHQQVSQTHLVSWFFRRQLAFEILVEAASVARMLWGEPVLDNKGGLSKGLHALRPLSIEAQHLDVPVILLGAGVRFGVADALEQAPPLLLAALSDLLPHIGKPWNIAAL